MAYRAHLALQKHHVLPGRYLELSTEEQAFLAASDSIWLEEKEQSF